MSDPERICPKDDEYPSIYAKWVREDRADTVIFRTSRYRAVKDNDEVYFIRIGGASPEERRPSSFI